MRSPIRAARFPAALLVGGALAAWAGCRPEAPCPECGTAVIAVGADADLLHPALVEGIGRPISDQLFLKLADVGLGTNTVGDSGFVPVLAESWSFPDPRTIVFRLHPAARWHDGEPVTARDVAFTFAAYRDTLVNAPARPLLDEIDSVVARDGGTVAFHFRRAYPSQFFDATHHMRILPAHLLDTVPGDRWRTHPFARAPVGNGPFRLARWQPGQFIELVADSGFFRGVPGLARLIWRVAPDHNATVTQLAAGEADFVEVVLGPENVRRVESDSALRLVAYPAPVYIYLGFNLRDPRAPGRAHPLLGERELRRAITLGIDRKGIIRAVLDGRGTVPHGPVSPMVWVADGAPPQLPFDSARAARMLDSLGWSDANRDGVRERGGRRLAFDLAYPTSSGLRERTSVIIQEQLHRLGVEVRLVPLELNAMLERARAGRVDAIMGGWQINLVPSGMRELWTSAGVGGLNYGGYVSPAFDAKVDEAAAATDLAVARALWHEAIGIINDDAPAVWLFAPSTVAGVSRRLANVTIRPDEWWATLWTWTAGRRGGG